MASLDPMILTVDVKMDDAFYESMFFHKSFDIAFSLADKILLGETALVVEDARVVVCDGQVFVHVQTEGGWSRSFYVEPGVSEVAVERLIRREIG